MKTLIVEDDAVSRLIMQKILQAYGPADTAVTGTEAVAASEDALHDYAPVLFNSAVFDLEEDNLAISADIKYDLKFPRNNLKTEPGKGGDLFLKVDGTEGDDGVLMAALFKSEDGFPSGYSRMAVAATANSIKVFSASLPKITVFP